MMSIKRWLVLGIAITLWLGCDMALAQSPQMTPEMMEQARRAVNQGLITPERARELQQKSMSGSLSQTEIDAGLKMMQSRGTGTATPQAETIGPTPSDDGRRLPQAVIDTSPGARQNANLGELPEMPPTDAPYAQEELVTVPEPPVASVEKPKAPETLFDEQYFKKGDEPEYPVLPIFGHDLFTSAPSTFAPVRDAPVADDYIVGPEDELKVITWGLLEADYSLVVNREGNINLPKIGRLTVAGLTFGEAKALIKGKLEAMTGVQAAVSMGALRSIQVMVLGEVKSPGIYTISSLARAANALLASGGPTRLGSLRKVQLKRNGKTIATLDLYNFLLKGDTSVDGRLMPGDVIFVPQAGPLVMVSGNVKRPAAYELKDSLTLETALNLAGGLAPRASSQRIQIERAENNRSQVVLDISPAELAGKKNIALRDGDLIRVFSLLPDAENAVFLYGNVRRPGRYAFRPGLKLADLLPDLESLEVESHLDYALIKRYHTKNMQAELVPFDLGALIVKKEPHQNLALMPLDEVYVFNKAMFQDEHFADVQGEVRRPGRFHIQNMKVRDLILKAGDLTPDAYLNKGEIIRIDAQRNRHTLYFNVGAAMQGDAEHNLTMQNEDRLVIHSIWEDQWKELVTIEGEVKLPGEYLLTAHMRLTDLIFKSGNFTRDAYPEIGHLYRTDWRTREKTILTFNITKALQGDEQHNLVLQDQDQVVVHSINEYVDQYTVSAQGLVNQPGDYPYAGNMTIKDLLIVAGNVKDAAYMDEAELVRFTIADGKTVETSIIKFNVTRALAGDPANNKKLEPLDVVTIKAIPEWWDKKKTVTVSGEVYFPGTYQIRKDERLSDIIARAGGYTEYAYLYGAVFTREKVKVVQKERLQDLSKRLETDVARMTSEEVQTALSPEDVAAQSQFVASQKLLMEKLKTAEPTGRVVIQLKPLIELAQSSENLVLEDGDTLLIPKKPDTINVLGAVYNPTALAYNEDNRFLRYYLEMTGGPTDNADRKSMYVVQANGTVVSSRKSAWWSDFENTKLNPGDTVLVPERVIRPSYMRDFKDITQILYQIATTAGVTALLF